MASFRALRGPASRRARSPALFRRHDKFVAIGNDVDRAGHRARRQQALRDQRLSRCGAQIVVARRGDRDNARKRVALFDVRPRGSSRKQAALLSIHSTELSLTADCRRMRRQEAAPRGFLSAVQRITSRLWLEGLGVTRVALDVGFEAAQRLQSPGNLLIQTADRRRQQSVEFEPLALGLAERRPFVEPGIGIGMFDIPRTPPTSMTATNVSGQSQSARSPLMAAHRTDRHHGGYMVETA